MANGRKKKASIPGSGTSTSRPTVVSGGSGPSSSYDALGLRSAADSIAQSASLLLGVVTAQHRPTPAQRLWRHTKSAVLFVSLLGGLVLALEQYLASQYDAAMARVEGQFSAASEALGSPDHIVQTNAVRTLARISEFSTYTVPHGVGALGGHLRAELFSYSPEYPYFDQIWLVLRDFATSRSHSTTPLVSSEILLQGAAWEHRSREGDRAPANQTRGSLLFRAILTRARGNDLDLHGLQFGAADLEGADLSGSNCSGCAMLGVNLSGGILRGAIFESAYLAEATMNNVDLSFARLSGAVVRRARLENVTFLQTDLSGTDFSDATLDGSYFSQADLDRTDFTRSSLRGVRFIQSDVSTAIFDHADVEGADFTRALGFSRSLLRTARNSEHALVPQPKEAMK